MKSALRLSILNEFKSMIQVRISHHLSDHIQTSDEMRTECRTTVKCLDFTSCIRHHELLDNSHLHIYQNWVKRVKSSLIRNSSAKEFHVIFTCMHEIFAHTEFSRTLTITNYLSVLFSTLSSILSVTNLSRLECAKTSCIWVLIYDSVIVRNLCESLLKFKLTFRRLLLFSNIYAIDSEMRRFYFVERCLLLHRDIIILSQHLLHLLKLLLSVKLLRELLETSWDESMTVAFMHVDCWLHVLKSTIHEDFLLSLSTVLVRDSDWSKRTLS